MTKLTARPYVELTIKQKCKCEHKYEKKLHMVQIFLHMQAVIICYSESPSENCHHQSPSQAKLVQLIVMQTWSLLSGAGCLAGLVGWPNCDELSTKEISQLSQCQPALTSIQHIQRVLSII